MTQIRRVSRKELTATEVLEIVENGGRVVIEVSVLGKGMDLVVREQDGIYYCDTPMKLLTHDSREELRECLQQFRLVGRGSAEERESPSVVA